MGTYCIKVLVYSSKVVIRRISQSWTWEATGIKKQQIKLEKLYKDKIKKVMNFFHNFTSMHTKKRSITYNINTFLAIET